MVIVLLELTSIVAQQGLKSYLKHRTKMIREKRENEFLGSRIRKISRDIYKSMSRENSPFRMRNTLDEIDEIPLPQNEMIESVPVLTEIYSDDVEEGGVHKLKSDFRGKNRMQSFMSKTISNLMHSSRDRTPVKVRPIVREILEPMVEPILDAVVDIVVDAIVEVKKELRPEVRSMWGMKRRD